MSGVRAMALLATCMLCILMTELVRGFHLPFVARVSLVAMKVAK